MSDWPERLAAVAGAIGAVTGIAGAAMGYVAYRRSSAMKALDLRVGARDSMARSREHVKAVAEQIPVAKKSRERVASARGLLDSGATKVFGDACEADLERLTELESCIPQDSEIAAIQSAAELETYLLHVRQLERELEELRSKYKQVLAQDDVDRAELRADARDLVNRGYR